MTREEEIFNKHSWSALGAISPSKDFCLSAMREYAREAAIGFAEWTQKVNAKYYDDTERWIAWFKQDDILNQYSFATDQLYDKYLEHIKQLK